MSFVHHTFTGTWLSPESLEIHEELFHTIPQLSAWQPPDITTEKCVYVVPSLSSDFLSLLPTAKVLVTTSGSVLSHLALLAREQQVPIFLITDTAFASLDESGVCSLQIQ